MTFAFTDLIAATPILPDLIAPDGAEAIRAVAGLLRGSTAVTNVEKLTAELLEREKLSPTAMGHGVAFPHARTDVVKQIVMAIGRSPAGVPFQGADGPVHFFFVIGTPPNQVPQYLAAVGRLARLLKTEAVRDQLFQATSAEAVRSVLMQG